VTTPIRRELRVAAELSTLLRSEIFRSPPRAPEPGLPVLLITGVYANDATLRPMAAWLKRMGHAPRRAGLRFNADCSEAEMARLELRLERAAECAGRPASIVGWSRGGLFARALAVRRPDLVAGIATLGSPLLNPLGYVHPILHLALEATSTLGDRGVPGLLSHSCADEWALDGTTDPSPISRALIARTRRLLADGERCCERFWRDVRGPFPKQVSFVSLYSKSDAIVSWPACLDPAARHVEVDASHCGMGVSKHVYRALADELGRIAGARRTERGEQALAA
jgi:pimeloyl-ACP methyl ester carboxylesterase